MKENRWAIGIDIGGTKIRAASVDEHGKILQEKTTSSSSVEAAIEFIIQSIKEFQKKANSHPAGIGIGLAAQVDSNKGFIHFAPNLGWRDIPFASLLQKNLKIPILITNDVRAATYGEWLHGAGRGCNNVVCLQIGTGIGGGVIVNGELLEGSSGTVAEFGHMRVNMSGPKCTCGQHGCLEAYAGGWAIGKMGHSTAKEVVAAFRSGAPSATKIIQEAKEALITGGVNVVHAFNPERLILGGGVVEGLPEIVEWMDVGIKEQALKAATTHLQVVRSALGPDAVVIGSAVLVLTTQV